MYLGTDTEFFFKDRHSGAILPSDAFLPDKYAPLVASTNLSGVTPETAAKRTVPGAALHWDGVQGELTLAETHCRAYILDRMREGFRVARTRASAKDAEISVDSCVETPPEILRATRPEAVVFGCDMDYRAWESGKGNPLGIEPETHYWRYAGTHIHVGFSGVASDKDVIAFLESFDGKLKVIKVMDWLVGNTLVLFEDDTAKLRRQLYGKAGVFRPTPYGVEYRVPGASISRHPALMSLTFSLARAAASIAQHRFEDFMAGLEPERVIVAINDVDRSLAMQNLLQIFAKSAVTKSPDHCYFGNLPRVLERGATFSYDLATNWHLDDPAISFHGSLTPGWESTTQ